MTNQPKFKLKDFNNKKVIDSREAYINVEDLKDITLYDVLREFNGGAYSLLAYTGYNSLDGVEIYEGDIVDVYKYKNIYSELGTEKPKVKLGTGKVITVGNGYNFYVACNTKNSTEEGKKFLERGWAEYSIEDDSLEFYKVAEYPNDDIE